MIEQRFETSATPHITVTECLDNLVVRGSEERRVTMRVQGDTDDVTLERAGETFTLQVRADCFLTCPPDTTIAVESVRGNLQVEEVKGPVTAGTAHGNVDLSAVGPTALEQVSGNLRVRQAQGDLRAQTVKGNARVHQVEGSLSLDHVDGNLEAAGLQGGLVAEQVRGNVRLGPPFSPGMTYRLNIHGNLTLSLPAESSLRLSLQAGGNLVSHVPGLVLEKTNGETTGALGAGEAILEAQAKGNVSLRLPEWGEGMAAEAPFGAGWGWPWEEGPAAGIPFDFVADLEGLEEQIETRIGEAMAEMNARLEESLGRISDERLREQARRQAERAMERARRAAERATERARRRAERESERVRREADQDAERSRMWAERAERRWQRASGSRPRPKSEPVTDEERMRILRMVEEGKVTPEQAADLLAAMEGR
jgi:hypothetical protein